MYVSIENYARKIGKDFLYAHVQSSRIVCVRACHMLNVESRDGRGRLVCYCEERAGRSIMGETETGEYPTTSCSSDTESSLGSDDSRVTMLQYNGKNYCIPCIILVLFKKNGWT